MKTITGASHDILPDWLNAHMDDAQGALNDHGAVLFRGFNTADAAVLKDALALFGAEPMQDARWSSPRSAVGEGAFTASEYPADQTIVLHSEMSYARLWPRLLLFQCKTPAATGGATTVCDMAKFSNAIADIVAEFHEREVMYVRNFRRGVDIPWQNAFGTDDKDEVERIGADHGMEVEWHEGDVLRTFQQAQGAIEGDDGPIWFNQAHLFHPSQLGDETRRTLMAAFGEEGLPRNAIYGDGEPIPDGVIAAILSALTAHTENIDWQAGDVAVIDNMRWMHGRAPFSGDRAVYVAMGRPQTDNTQTRLF